MQHMHEHEKLEKDPLANEQTCSNEVCGCTMSPTSAAGYCSEYCQGEGQGRGEGACQCGHVACA
jgi:hypothetical protein